MKPTRRDVLIAGFAALIPKKSQGHSTLATRLEVWPPKPDNQSLTFPRSDDGDIILDLSGPNKYKYSGLVLTAGMEQRYKKGLEVRVINSKAPKDFTDGFIAIHESILKHAQIKVREREDGKKGVELLIYDNKYENPISSLMIDYPFSEIYAVNDKLEILEMSGGKLVHTVTGGIEDERSGRTVASNLQNAIDRLFSNYIEAGGKTEKYTGNITDEFEKYEKYIEEIRKTAHELNKRIDDRQKLR